MTIANSGCGIVDLLPVFARRFEQKGFYGYVRLRYEQGRIKVVYIEETVLACDAVVMK